MEIDIEKIKEKLREVIDPELGYDIISLGELENIRFENNEIIVTILPTTPMCPYLPYIVDSVKNKLIELGFDINNITIEIDYESKWDLDRIDPKVRRELGL